VALSEAQKCELFGPVVLEDRSGEVLVELQRPLDVCDLQCDAVEPYFHAVGRCHRYAFRVISSVLRLQSRAAAVWS